MNKKHPIATIIGTLTGLILVFGLSWIIFNILAWLICLCFHLTFDILIGTGIWLCYLLLCWIIKSICN